MKRIISILLSISIIVLCFAGCSGNKTIDFIYPFSADVNSYDPQVAGTTDEYLIIENTFEGLIRINDNGEVKAGVAESWDKSSDGLTYTFNLKKGIKWNINTDKNDKGEFKDERLLMLGKEFNPDITAHDFVFALQRACMPETECPLFSSVSCIKNAVSINKGKMNHKHLGAKAIDDYTLQIQLSTPDDGFMQALTTAVAMPCNEEFFNATKGKYGLDTEHTLFNGQFYVSQILETSYLLNKNKYYKGDYPAYASELTLKITSNENENETIERLESGYYDCALLNGFDTEKIKHNEGITFSPYNDTTWAFILNTNDEVLQSKTIRKALCYAFTRLDKPSKEFLSNATGLTPESCLISSRSSNEAFGKTATNQDIEKSIELWKRGLEIIEQTNVSLTVLTTKDMEQSVKAMLQGVQSGIGSIVKNNKGESVSFTIKVETVKQDEIDNAIATQTYDIALYPFKSKSNSALTYLKGFYQKNLTGFDSRAVKKNISKAENASSEGDAIKYAKKAEKEILDSYSIIPMLYETSYYASAKGVDGVQYHSGTGRVSFVNATRK